jgi:hypothetical protein
MSIRIKWTACAALIATAALSAGAQAAAVNMTTAVTDLSSSSQLTLSNNFYFSDFQTYLNGQSAGATHSEQGFDSVPTAYNVLEQGPGGNFVGADVTTDFGLPGTKASVLGSGYATSTIQWSFDWTASESGAASINLGYLFSPDIVNVGSGENVLARYSIGFMLDAEHSDSAVNFYKAATSLDDAGFGSLALNFDVLAGQTGSVVLTLTSDALVAPVPLPAGLPLLGSALLGLAGWARRRRGPVAA